MEQVALGISCTGGFQEQTRLFKYSTCYISVGDWTRLLKVLSDAMNLKNKFSLYYPMSTTDFLLNLAIRLI